MDCLTFLDRLTGVLDGTLTPQERVDTEQHAAACADCRELLQMAHQRTSGAPREDSPDMVGAVLERTVGSACGRAADLLCDFVDGGLDPDDSAILAAHLEHCAPCQALALNLRELTVVLHDLGDLQPDAGFVGAVLDRTSRREPAASWLPDWLAGSLRSLVERPRFAFEVAYIGVVLFVLLFGNPATTLQAASERTAGMAAAGISRIRTALPAALSSLPLTDLRDARKVVPVEDMRADLAGQCRALARTADGWWARGLGVWSARWGTIRRTVDQVLGAVDAQWRQLREALEAVMGRKTPVATPSGRPVGADRTEPQAPPVR